MTGADRAIPPSVLALLWEHAPDTVRAETHEPLLMRRVLAQGSWSDVRWLRSHFGEAAIRNWIRKTSGRCLDRRTLRLWQVLLDLEPAEVESWLADGRRRVWDGRLAS